MEQAEGKVEPKNPEQILRFTAIRFNELDMQAEEALKQRDGDTSLQRLQQRAQLIVSLPSELQEAIERGETFPSEEMRRIQDFSYLASEMLKASNVFGLGTLLTHKGLKIDEPNDLEQLINRVYPPKKPSGA